MALENLKSIFTEGFKKFENTDVTKMDSRFSETKPFFKPDMLSKFSQYGKLKDSKITDIRDSMNSEYSKTNEPRYHNFVTEGINPEALYIGKEYDPRMALDRDTITNINSYSGTRFTQFGLMGNNGEGIGGLFNNPSDKYSISFRTINKPTLDDIIERGNISTGGGYEIKQSIIKKYNIEIKEQ